MTTKATEPSGKTGPCGAVLQDGWYVLERREGLLITNALVQQLLDETDLEDAGAQARQFARVKRLAGALL
jgi:hypothetical protein